MQRFKLLIRGLLTIGSAFSSIYLLLLFWEVFGSGSGKIVPKSISICVGISGGVFLLGSFLASKFYWRMEHRRKLLWSEDIRRICDTVQLRNKKFVLEDLAEVYEEHDRKEIREELLKMEKGSRDLQKAIDLTEGA